jgi:DNA-binding response OmpR family regulator
MLPVPPGPSRPVLVVEDDPDMRRFLVDALTLAGLRVVAAVNGLEALESLRRNQPCAVVLDLGLPLLDGSGFVTAARSDPELPTVPIICISGRPDAREQAKRLGLRDCLVKPVTAEAVVARVLERCSHD